MAEFTNKATLTVAGVSIDSNTVRGTRGESGVTIAKSALLPTYGEGPVTYLVSIVNNGAQDISAMTLTDDLGAYEFNSETKYPFEYVEHSAALYISGAEQTPPAPDTAQPLVFSGLEVPAGGNLLLIYAAQPTAYAPRGGDVGVVNNVTATAGQTALEASATVLPGASGGLTVAKSVTPDSAVEGETLNYTVVVLNGSGEEYGEDAGVVISDLLNPALSQLEVTLDGAALEEGTGYTYDESTGTFATVAGVVTVPAAVFAQDPDTGAWSTSPGAATLRISGTV